MKSRTNILASLLAFGLASSATSEVVLPRIIGDKMILQRGVSAPVWGWADPGEKVTVSFAGQTKETTPDESGKWMVELHPLKASAEPRVMTVRGGNEIKVADVLVGEVWLASGQSNMEWAFRMVDEEERSFAVEQKDNPLVRAFHVNQHVLAGVPLDDTVGWWKDCAEMLNEPQLSAGNIRGVSAVGFFFALKLQQELGVPVAFLDCSWGGRPIESFIAAEGYEAAGLEVPQERAPDRAALTESLKLMKESSTAALKAAEGGRLVAVQDFMNLYGRTGNDIYNAMIAPLAPYAIKGAIWYQGESNRTKGDYFEKLKALSAGWSKVFRVEDIPLHLVQIAPYDYERDRRRKDSGPGRLSSTLANNIWLAQYRGAEEIAGMSVVAIHDTGIDINNIHPRYKLPVGNRLAAMALKAQYGKDVTASGPSFAAAKRNGSKVVVSFDNLGQGLSTRDGEAPCWFELSADGERFVGADAVIRGETVEVTAAGVVEPKFVRMGWYDTAIPNLQDKNGWPVFAFPAQPVK